MNRCLGSAKEGFDKGNGMPRAQSYPGNTRGTMIAHTRTGAPPPAWGGVRIRQRRRSQGSPLGTAFCNRAAGDKALLMALWSQGSPFHGAAGIGDWRLSSVGKMVPGLHKTLGSIPSTKGTRFRGNIFNPSPREGKAGGSEI